jgi:hypothetical protein
MSEFREITQNRNWVDFDQLDGTDLKDGELLEFRMPDGSIHRKPVVLKTFEEEGYDMGHRYDIPHKEACVTFTIHGYEALIRLHSAKATARRVQ